MTNGLPNHGSVPMPAPGLLGELSRRRVFRVAVTYVIVAWLAVQVADALAPALHLPDWAVAFVVYVLVLCFPVAMVLAWAFDVGPAGIVATAPTSGTRARPRQVLVLGVLAVAGTLMLFGVLSVTVGGVSVQADAAQLRSGELRGRAIAIVPLVDSSPGQDQAWLAESLGQELMNGVASIPGIQVAEASAAHAARAGSDVREVGRQLGVHAVLSGNIQRVGSRVRVTVRLTDTVSGYQIWSESYDGLLDDVFAFQADTADRIGEDISGLYAGLDRN